MGFHSDRCRGAIAGGPMVGYDLASKQRWLDYHNQHESAAHALIVLFHVAFSVLPPVESYRNYRKPTKREVGLQGYLSSLQVLQGNAFFLCSGNKIGHVVSVGILKMSYALFRKTYNTHHA